MNLSLLDMLFAVSLSFGALGLILLVAFAVLWVYRGREEHRLDANERATRHLYSK
jgi:hypothetical protein